MSKEGIEVCRESDTYRNFYALVAYATMYQTHLETKRVVDHVSAAVVRGARSCVEWVAIVEKGRDFPLQRTGIKAVIEI